MNTNQIMTVKIGNFGVLEIGHKTMVGKVSQVLEMGNRKAKNLEPIPLKEILRKQDLWEFIISRHTQLLRNSNPLKLEVKKFLNSWGHIRYSTLIKQFPHLIISKKGKLVTCNVRCGKDTNRINYGTDRHN